MSAWLPSGQKATVYVGTCAVTDPANCRPDAAAWTPGGVTQYSYAPDGLNIHQVGRDLTNGQPGTRTITTSYDQAGRPIAVADNSSNITVSARYYLDGLLRSVDDGTDSSTYAYTGTGQVSVRTDHTGSGGVTGGATKVTSYAYNDAGLPARMASDVTGTAASWSYDPAGRPVGRVDTNSAGGTRRTTSIGYKPDDTLARYSTSAAGSTIASDAYTYDDDGNILTHAVSGSAQSFTNSYSYNPAGNLTGFTQNRGGSTTSTSYSFDHDANRLTSSTTGASTTSTTWTYRADDAIKTAQSSGQSLLTFGYSAAGELTDDGCFTYTYDEFSRTATSTLDSGAAASCGRPGATSYSYDGLDRQQQAVITGSSRNGTVHNSYDGLSTTLIGQAGALTGSGASAPDVLYALNPDGAAVAYTQTGSSSSTFLDQDGYGNITSLLNTGSTSAGCAVNYDPYGNPILGTTPPANGNGVCASGSAAATTGNSIWYRGQARAFTTGSYQLGARTYQPNLGTFTTPDTYRVDTPDTDLSVGTDPLTENSYSYVNGNPVNFTDPNGHLSGAQCGPDGIYCGEVDADNPASDGSGRGRGAPGSNLGGAKPAPYYTKTPSWDPTDSSERDAQGKLIPFNRQIDSATAIANSTPDWLSRQITNIGSGGLYALTHPVQAVKGIPQEIVDQFTKCADDFPTGCTGALITTVLLACSAATDLACGASKLFQAIKDVRTLKRGGELDRAAAAETGPGAVEQVIARNGANLAKVAGQDQAAIQSAATRIGKPISLVGSRSTGNISMASDYDYVVTGATKEDIAILRKALPSAYTGIGEPPGIDIFTSGLEPGMPYITFTP